MTVLVGSPGELVGGVLGGGVVTLPGQDYRSVEAANQHGLVAAGMSGRGNQEYPGQSSTSPVTSSKLLASMSSGSV